MFLVAVICITSTAFSQINKSFSESSVSKQDLNARVNWINNYPDKCFCCDGVYNLQEKPQIIGPQTVDCESPITFTTGSCKGTSINWSVSPSTAFTGQGTSSITLNPPYIASSYTVNVSIRCGEKTVTNAVSFVVSKPQNCIPNFLVGVEQLANGFVKINAVPSAGAGVEHYWGVVYNGTYPNCNLPCTGIPLVSIQNGSTYGAHLTSAGAFSALGMGTSITSGSSPYGFNYSGFPNNSCFKITHYVRCCGEWFRQTACVSIGTSNLKVIGGEVAKPQITMGEIEKVN